MIACPTCEHVIPDINALKDHHLTAHRENLFPYGYSGVSVIIFCDRCGKRGNKRYASQIDNLNSENQYCSRDCAIEDRDIDYINKPLKSRSGKLYGRGWNKISKKVKKRDRYTCQKCGKNKANDESAVIQTHHKISVRFFDSPEDANQLDNLTTLCISCHRQTDASQNKFLRDFAGATL
jgi:ribosomal protein L37AE/L43A